MICFTVWSGLKCPQCAYWPKRLQTAHSGQKMLSSSKRAKNALFFLRGPAHDCTKWPTMFSYFKGANIPLAAQSGQKCPFPLRGPTSHWVSKGAKYALFFQRGQYALDCWSTMLSYSTGANTFGSPKWPKMPSSFEGANMPSVVKNWQRHKNNFRCPKWPTVLTIVQDGRKFSLAVKKFPILYFVRLLVLQTKHACSKRLNGGFSQLKNLVEIFSFYTKRTKQDNNCATKLHGRLLNKVYWNSILC